MDFDTGRPNHIEDYLVSLHTGQWFGWSDSKNKVYENLIIHDISKDKPTEQECIDGLAQRQSDFDDKQTKNTNDAIEQAIKHAIFVPSGRNLCDHFSRSPRFVSGCW